LDEGKVVNLYGVWDRSPISFIFSLISLFNTTNILCFSWVDKKSGKNWFNFSGDTLEALRAAVPDIPPLVTIVRNSKLGYFVIDLVREAISAKSASFSSLAPITHNT